MLLQQFQTYLTAQGVMDKKQEQHTKNVEQYFVFLTKKGISPDEGIQHLDGYFGDWFIRNCPTASETQIVLSIASLRKFYAMLKEQGEVTSNDYDTMERIINSRKESWKEAMDAHTEEQSAAVVPEGAVVEDDEDGHSASPKWESKSSKFSDDLGAGEDVDISSGFSIEGGEKDEDDDDMKDEDDFADEFADEFGEDEDDKETDDDKDDAEDDDDNEFREKYEDDDKE